VKNDRHHVIMPFILSNDSNPSLRQSEDVSFPIISTMLKSPFDSSLESAGESRAVEGRFSERKGVLLMSPEERPTN